MSKILICDTCEVFRHGLTVHLQNEHDVVAATSAEGLERGPGEADLVIVDVVNACRVQRHAMPHDVPLLLLIDDGASHQLCDVLAGVSPTSVLHRNAPMRTAIVAVDTTLCGGRYVDPAVSAWRDGIVEVLMMTKEFTMREREVCRMVLDGRLAPEVARRLGLSVHTVKHHLSSIYAKAGVSGRGELAELFSTSRLFL